MQPTHAPAADPELRPAPRKDFLAPPELIPSLLMAWDFCSSYRQGNHPCMGTSLLSRSTCRFKQLSCQFLLRIFPAFNFVEGPWDIDHTGRGVVKSAQL